MKPIGDMIVELFINGDLPEDDWKFVVHIYDLTASGTSTLRLSDEQRARVRELYERHFGKGEPA